MSIFAVTYTYGAPEDQLATLRAEHRDYLAHLPELLVSGPASSSREALLVFRADTREQVESLVAADPFVSAGFVAQHVVRDWKPILGPLSGHFDS
ncbi:MULTISPECIES: YciI family protein [Aeromicrobium]|jgi:uncharacterized protein YciI|uniref:YCII-related domain-containing protein n=1 Tax=Aeromicrobium erythreum TaxID=2041 RepID=A0A0U3T6L2_9ACTN|nr:MULTISPECIES: YciI family protein [Aeromicrobium]ALX06232.1 hypothetical protein AERYTH_16785 [Aeromicrobium erythreum]